MLAVASETGAKNSDDKIEVFLDLEHSILQPVPAANVKNLKNSTVVQVGARYFALANDAAESIKKLLRDPKVELSIVGNAKVPEAETRALLNAVILTKGEPPVSLNNVVTSVIAYDQPDDLMTKNCKNPKKCVLVTDSETPKLKDESGKNGYILNTGKSLFEFPSLASANDAAEALKKADAKKFEADKNRFPANEEEWNLHEKRAAGIYDILNTAIKSDRADAPLSFGETLKTELAKPFSAAEDHGQNLLRATTQWKTLGGKIEGCEEKLPSGTLQPLDISICQKELPTHLAWTGVSRKTCTYVNDDGATLETSLETCLGKLKTYYLWTEKQLDNCGVFNEYGVLVQQAPKEKCTIDVICDSKSGVLSEFTKNLANQLTFKVLKGFSEIKSEASSLNRPSSFASILMNPTKSKNLIDELGSSCSDFLKKIYARGQDLSSPILIAASHPLSQETFASGTSHNNFYHHTKSNAFPDSLHPEIHDRAKAQQVIDSDGAFDNTMFFLRERPSYMGGLGLWLDALYVAEDPNSSSGYGPLTVELNFDPEKTKIIDQQSEAWKRAYQELDKKYPGLLSACGSYYSLGNVSQAKEASLQFMAADDSGIDMIDYAWGGPAQAHMWFQVISLKNVTSTSVH